MHIEIDADRCTGHGRCYALAPGLFDCDDDGHGEIRAEVVAGDGGSHRSGELDDGQLGKARLAVDNCPEAAITLVE